MVKVDGGGERKNAGKLPMHLVPVSAIRSIAEVLRFGANKYAERNWERGFNFSIPYACAMRHLTAWWEGENNDQESQLNHLKHALTNIAMIIEFLETYPEGDDRPKADKIIQANMVKESDLDNMYEEFKKVKKSLF